MHEIEMVRIQFNSQNKSFFSLRLANRKSSPNENESFDLELFTKVVFKYKRL